MNILHVCLQLMLMLMLAIGCGDSRVGRLTAPVTGKVTYQGKPLGKGRIIFFHPTGQAVGADIAADGSFKVAAFQGNNQVAIDCREPDRPNPNPNARPPMLPGKSLVPERYLNPSTPGLTFDVKAGGNHDGIPPERVTIHFVPSPLGDFFPGDKVMANRWIKFASLVALRLATLAATLLAVLGTLGTENCTPAGPGFSGTGLGLPGEAGLSFAGDAGLYGVGWAVEFA